MTHPAEVIKDTLFPQWLAIANSSNSQIPDEFHEDIDS